MGSRNPRRHPAQSSPPLAQHSPPQNPGDYRPPFTNSQRDDLIVALAGELAAMKLVVDEVLGAHNGLTVAVNNLDGRMQDLEGTRPPKKEFDEVDEKVLAVIRGLPKGFHFNAKSIADTMGPEYGSHNIGARMRKLVRHGIIMRHTQDGRNASFTLAPGNE